MPPSSPADRFQPGPSDTRSLRASLSPFESADPRQSLLQILTSIGLFLAACGLMYVTAGYSVLATLLLALPTGALLVRVFIVQHDCGHGSFFASRTANSILGNICGLLTLTPYANWRRQHAQHHASWNNLDKRTSGMDIYSDCLTVAEYQALSPGRRALHRILRHPLVMHLLLPPLVFLLLYRLPFDTPVSWRRERRSVLFTNLGLLVLFGGLIALFGAGTVTLVHLPVVAVAAIIGVWLFTLQHRFDRALWSRDADWNFVRASLQGTSHLKLPRLLQWFTGNIGLHHVHHLAPRIPNYRLQSCHDAVPGVHTEKPLDLAGGLRAIWLSLWDERLGRLVRIADLPATQTRL